MFVASNFFAALAQVVDVILSIAYWLILIRALISWVSPDPYNPIVQFLYKATEPILYPIRKLLRLDYRIGIDISPLIAFVIIMFLRTFLVRTLLDLSRQL
jgi:YggT family protein